MIRVLLVLAAFALLYGCGQTSSPVETQEKQEGAERAAPAPEPTTPTGNSDGVSGEEQAAAAYDADCRLAIYVAEENMSRQEAKAFSELLADMIRTMEDPSLTASSVRNAALDHLGVPRYRECEVRSE
jgi:hypothetical protein